MGVVYRAEDIKLDRPVALKFLPAHLLNDGDIRKALRTRSEVGGGAFALERLPRLRNRRTKWEDFHCDGAG